MSTTTAGTVETETYRTIRDGLLNGRWRPGERLPELKLAAELGVNRNPVREALLSLASEGLVERRPGLGAEVTSLDRTTLVNLYQLREAVEGMSARLAAVRISPIALLRLDQENDLLRRLAMSRLRHDSGIGEIDNRFHRGLVEAGGNAVLVQVWDAHRLRAVSARNVLIDPRAARRAAAARDPRIAIAAHERILQALRDRDPDAAERHARAHVATALKALASLLEDTSAKRDRAAAPRRTRGAGADRRSHGQD
jgi:DNA-binding GntR family transcriptional regulator